MEFVIGFGFFIGAVVTVVSLLYEANRNNMGFRDNHQDFQNDFWENEHSASDSSVNHTSIFEPMGSTLGSDSDDDMFRHVSQIEINPATGLPMVGGVDVAGNPYGTSSDTLGISSHTDMFSDVGGSAFNDSFSSFDDSFSSFDDSFSSFDDY